MKRSVIIISALCALLCSCADGGASSISRAETSSVTAAQTTTETTTVTTTTTTETTTTTAATTTVTNDESYFESVDINGGHEIIAEIDGNSYARYSGKFTEGGKKSPLSDIVIQRENYTHRGEDVVEAQYYIPYDRLSDLGASGIRKDGSVIRFSHGGYDVTITDGELIITDPATGESEFGFCGNIQIDGVFYVAFKSLVPLFGGKVTEYTDDACPYIIWCDFEM